MPDESIVTAAFAIPDPAARAAYLDQTCGPDTALRRQVEAELATRAAGGPPADPDRTRAYQAAGPAAAGDPVGPYRLADRIGAGGMGEVWAADQHQPIRRRVAVKLIKAGMDSRQVLARFEAERQALAVMDHPNIAKVLDGGLHAGRPYFVMELVKGVPITDYCDARRLTPRQRLELFVPVCQAIQHAHQKGIIHRDIKPSNVLVAQYDDRPVPKVIDFGVAKATGGTLTERTLDTGFGVVGTPQYMSPEQASLNALDVDTRSDVYSLGVLLYELLAGSPPFSRAELGEKGLLEVLRVIREEEPPRPSTKLCTADALPALSASRGTEPKALTGLLRSELDWIVMKALEKDRTRRYETVNGFAADVQRYLNGEPVQAHPPNVGYRLKKFVRRHRAQAVAAGAVLLTLLLGIAGTTFGLLRADERRREAERARADEAAQRAEVERQAVVSRRGLAAGRGAVDRAFTRISEDKLLAVPGLQPLRRELLEDARRFYSEFVTAWGDEPSLRADLADVTVRLAQVTAEIGTGPEAVAAHKKAVELCDRLRADPELRAAAIRGASSARVGLGKLHMEQFDHDAARSAYETALRDLEGQPDMSEFRETVRGMLALSLIGLNRPDEAEGHLATAIAATRGRVAAQPARADLLHTLAGQINTLGAVRNAQKRYTEAEAVLREAIDTERQALALSPKEAEYQEWLGNHLFNRAVVLDMRLNRRAEAVAARREAAEAWGRLAADNPAVVKYQLIFARACVDLGSATKRTAPDESDAWYARGRPVLEKLIAYDPSQAVAHSTLGSLLDSQSERQYAGGRYAAALDLLASALAASERALALVPDDPQFRRFQASHLKNLARVHQKLERPDLALAAAQRATGVYDRLNTTAPSDDVAVNWAEAHLLAAQSLLDAEKPDDAARELETMLAVAQRAVAHSPDHAPHAESVTNAISGLCQLQPTKAAGWREKEASYWQTRVAARPGDVRAAVAAATAMIERGELAAEAEDWATALKWFEPARVALKAVRDRNPNDRTADEPFGKALKWVGDVHWQQEKPIEAAAAWGEAADLYRARLRHSPDDLQLHFVLGGLLHNLGSADYRAGRYEQALGRLATAIELQRKVVAGTPDQGRRWLSNSLDLRATVLRDLGRWADAMADTTERVGLAAGKPTMLRELAREAAACVVGAADDRRLAEQADAWGARAIGWLKVALDTWADPAAEEAVASDPALAPLRNRPDFRALFRPRRESAPPPRAGR